MQHVLETTQEGGTPILADSDAYQWLRMFLEGGEINGYSGEHAHTRTHTQCHLVIHEAKQNFARFLTGHEH